MGVIHGWLLDIIAAKRWLYKLLNNVVFFTAESCVNAFFSLDVMCERCLRLNCEVNVQEMPNNKVKNEKVRRTFY